jgi:hypothetical protein
MATEVREELAVLAARGDSIRVVPLYVPDDLTRPIGEAAPAVAPKLT